LEAGITFAALDLHTRDVTRFALAASGAPLGDARQLPVDIDQILVNLGEISMPAAVAIEATLECP